MLNTKCIILNYNLLIYKFYIEINECFKIDRINDFFEIPQTKQDENFLFAIEVTKFVEKTSKHIKLKELHDDSIVIYVSII